MTSGDLVASVLASAMCLVLVGSNLIARRLPTAVSLKLAAVWLTIFAAGFAIVTVWRSIKAGEPPSANAPTQRNFT